MMRSKDFKRLGILTFGAGNVLNLMALALTPASLCAALSAMQFITHVGFCWLFFNEAPTKRVVGGTLMLTSALVLIILCHARSSGLQSPAEQIQNFHLVFPAYITAVLTLSAILVMVFRRLYGQVPLPKGLLCGLVSSEDAGGMGGGLLPLAIFVSLSAAPGSLANVCGKVLSLEIGEISIGAPPFFLRMFVVFLLGLGLIAFWLRQLGRALGTFKESWTIPFCQSCWIFWTMLSGGVIFREFEALSRSELAGFCLGMAILFTGAFLQRPVADEEKASLRHSPCMDEEAGHQRPAHIAGADEEAADRDIEAALPRVVIGKASDSATTAGSAPSPIEASPAADDERASLRRSPREDEAMGQERFGQALVRQESSSAASSVSEESTERGLEAALPACDLRATAATAESPMQTTDSE